MHKLLFRMLMYSSVVNIALVPLSTRLAALAGYVELISYFLYSFFRACRRKRKSISLMVHRDVLAFAIVVGISAFTGLPNLKIENIVSILVPVASFICFYWALSFPDEGIRDISFREIEILNYVLTVLYLLYAFGNFSFKYMLVGEYKIPVFSLGLGNPNGVAIYVLSCTYIHILSFFQASKWKKRVLTVLIALLVYILILLNSRMVFLCFLIVLGGYITKLYRRIGPKICWAFLVVPFAALFGQLLLKEIMDSMMIFGETFDTGRITYYLDFIKYLKKNPGYAFFGNIVEYPFTNLHNAPICIFASLGIAGVVVYSSFWSKKLRYIRQQSVTDYQKFALLCFLSLFFDSAAEVMTVTGGIPYSIWMLIIAKIAQGEIPIGGELQPAQENQSQ